MTRAALALALGLVALALAACATPAPRFALRDPFTRDTDLAPVTVPCRSDPSAKEPGRVTCAPEVYVSPFVWDQVDNAVFAPLSRLLSVEAVGEAVNANSLDEVADSAWFENRIGARPVTAEQLAAGGCTPDDLLPSEIGPGAWLIDRGKSDGASAGFRVSVPGKGIYMLKADTAAQPEHASSAAVIGSAIYHAVGFHTTCEQVVYIERSQLTLSPGLTTTDNDGFVHLFDEHALRIVLAASAHRGDRTRMTASKWLAGFTLGPFRYVGTRDDDPHDIIPHQHRRELRGSRLLAAWLDHWDSREQNSMDVWLASDPKRVRSSPGYVRHYLLDTSDVLGQAANPDTLGQRLGHSYAFDPADFLVDFVTFGIIERPWDRAARTPGRERFGFFSARDFVPQDWKGAYPNPAFTRMTERDGAWMARIIARFTRDQIEAIARAAQLTDPTDATYLTDILLARRRAILDRYLTRLSPLADVRREPDGRICAVDLARAAGLFAPDRFRYQIVEQTPHTQVALAAAPGPNGEVCFAPRAFAPDGLADDAAERLTIIRITNGTPAGPLEIHTYDLGPRGLRVVGLRRPAP